MGRAVLINRPPTSTLRSLGPVNFHSVSLLRSRSGGEQIQFSPAIVGQQQSSTTCYSGNTSLMGSFNRFRISSSFPSVTLWVACSRRNSVEEAMPSFLANWE